MKPELEGKSCPVPRFGEPWPFGIFPASMLPVSHISIGSAQPEWFSIRQSKARALVITVLKLRII
jgi:hypothetical protein